MNHCYADLECLVHPLVRLSTNVTACAHMCMYGAVAYTYIQMGHIRPGTKYRPQWASKLLYAHTSIYAHTVHKVLNVYCTHNTD